MKTVFIDSLKQLIANRYLLVLSSALMALAIAFVLYIVLTVHPSELQLVSHYSAFGITHLYRDQWTYLFVFAVFGVLAALAHIAIGLKLTILKGPAIGLMYVWLGVAIVLIAWITSSAVLNVWSPI